MARAGTLPQEAPNGKCHEAAIRRMLGAGKSPSLDQPDSEKSAPPAMKSDPGAKKSIPTDPLMGYCWESREHSHEH